MYDNLLHPCFSDGYSHAYRIHLPVSSKCNIKCNFCSRKYIVQNEKAVLPGRSSETLRPDEALKKLVDMKYQYPEIKVVGFAGPGDNLYNAETFQTIKLIRQRFPDIMLCVSTNGVLLGEKLQSLIEYKVTHVTVTVNAVNPEIGSKIYAFATDKERYLFGEKAAAWIIKKQLEGIRRTVEAGIHIKVNSVLIPGINDAEMEEIAKEMSKRGVELMNIMPLIPSSVFKDRRVPTSVELESIRTKCQPIVRQMVNCQQCSADAFGPVPCSHYSKKCSKNASNTPFTNVYTNTVS